MQLCSFLISKLPIWDCVGSMWLLLRLWEQRINFDSWTEKSRFYGDGVVLDAEMLIGGETPEGTRKAFVSEPEE